MWDNDTRNSFDFNFNTPDGENVTLNFKAVSVEHILTKFEDFLQGCGYKLNGQLKIIPSQTNASSQKAYAGSFNSMPASSSGAYNYPTSGGITKEQIAALQPISLQSINPLKNEDILHFGV